MKTVNDYIYGGEKYSNYSIVQAALERPITQQEVIESSPIISTRPMAVKPSETIQGERGRSGIFEVIREVTLSNTIPKGSRMMSTPRTFKVGETFEGLDNCKNSANDADTGYIKVVDGLTYHFSCGRGKALRHVEDGVEDIAGKGATSEPIEEPSFLEKYKMPLIAVGVIAAVGVGYYFMKKK